MVWSHRHTRTCLHALSMHPFLFFCRKVYKRCKTTKRAKHPCMKHTHMWCVWLGLATFAVQSVTPALVYQHALTVDTATASFCAPGHMPTGMHAVPAATLYPGHDSVLARAPATGPCQPASEVGPCGLNEVHVFSLADDARDKYACLCAAGFYRASPTSGCIACPAENFVCPHRSDDLFACPVHSQPLQGALPATDHGVPFCVPDVGYTLQSNMNTFRHRFQLPASASRVLYRAVPSRACPLNARLHNGACVCRDGFFAPTGGASTCQPCTPGNWCADGAQSLCPAPWTSARMATHADNCSIPVCVPGQFLDAGTGTCQPCSLGHWCTMSQRQSCPHGSSTISVYSQRAEDCRCHEGLQKVHVKGIAQPFVCVRRDRARRHELLDLSLPRAGRVRNARAWSAPEQPGGAQRTAGDLIGARLVLSNYNASLQATLLFHDAAAHTAVSDVDGAVPAYSRQTCELLTMQGNYTNTSAAGRGLALRLHTSLACASDEDPGVDLHTLSVTWSSLDQRIHFEYGPARALYPFRTGRTQVSELPATGDVVRTNAEVSDAQDHESWRARRVMEQLAERMHSLGYGGGLDSQAAVVRRQRVRFEPGAALTVDCFARHGPSPTAILTQTAAAHALAEPVIHVLPDGGSFCVDAPQTHRGDIVYVDENTTELHVTVGVETIIAWPDDDPFQLHAVPGLQQTVHTVDALVERCANAMAHNGVLLQALYNNTARPGSWPMNATQLEDALLLAIDYTSPFGLFNVTQLLPQWDTDADGLLSLSEFAVAQAVNVSSEFQRCVDALEDDFRFAQTVLLVPATGDTPALAPLPGRYAHVAVLLQGPDSTRTPAQDVLCFRADTCQPQPPPDSLPASPPSTATPKFELVVRETWLPCPAHSVASPDSTMCVCDAGWTMLANQTACRQCQPHELCLGGTTAPQECSLGAADVRARACACLSGSYYADGACLPCPAAAMCEHGKIWQCPGNMTSSSSAGRACVCQDGFYGDTCKPCPRGSWCRGGQRHACRTGATSPERADSPTACACAPGYGRSADSTCTVCEQGTYSAQQACVPCAHDETTVASMSPNASACVCRAGFERADAQCRSCAGASYACAAERRVICPANMVPSSDNSACVCRTGYLRVAGGDACMVCPAGFFCHEAAGHEMVQCPARMTSTQGASHASDCFCANRQHVQVYVHGSPVCSCPPSFYAQHDQCVPCPVHSRRLLAPHDAATNDASQCLCEPGYYVTGAVLGQATCALCEPGFWCPGSRFNQARNACPARTSSVFWGLDSPAGCVACNGTAQAAPASSANAWPSQHPVPAVVCGRLFLPLHIGEEDSSASEPGFHLFSSYDALPDANSVYRAILHNIERALGPDHGIRHSQGESTASQSSGQAEYQSSWYATNTFGQNVLKTVVAAHGPAFESMKALLHTRPHAADTVLPHVFFLLMQEFTAMLPARTMRFVTPHAQAGAWNVATEIAQLVHRAPLDSTAPVAADLAPARRRVFLKIHQVYNEQTTFPNVALQDIYEAFSLQHGEQGNLALVPTGTLGEQLLDNLQAMSAYRTLHFQMSPFQPTLTNQDENLCANYTGMTTSCAVPEPDNLLCVYCRPGLEFRNASSGLCQTCTVFAEGSCSRVQPCCGHADAQCLQESTESTATADATACGNGRIDIALGEECDWAQDGSACCAADCRLRPGFYSFPLCSSRCGDGIVAAGEQCDSSFDDNCNSETCRCFAGFAPSSAGLCSRVVI